MRSPYKFACVRCAGRCIPNCSASKLRDGKQAMLYKYDQLNRITKSRSLAFGNNAYAARSGEQKYDEDYSYNADGGLMSLQRRDETAQLKNDFAYSYYANTHRIQKLSAAGGTYEYDAIGNLIKNNREGTTITWTPSGKVRTVTKADTVTTYRYDAAGNRIAEITKNGASPIDTTHYVLDAAGNIMAVYRNKKIEEQPIYGSARIGEYAGKEKEGYQTFNLRKYELTNHLGNVLAVISDKVNLYGHSNILDSARATVMSASDYYPFGLAMQGRTYQDSVCRYGFNGKRKDNRYGRIAKYNYGFRIYSPEDGVFLSVDPLTKEYPFYSPYQFASNSPILAIDLDGLESSNIKNKTETKASEKGKPTENRNVKIADLPKANNIESFLKGAIDYLKDGDKISGSELKNFINPDDKKEGEKQVSSILSNIDEVQVVKLDGGKSTDLVIKTVDNKNIQEKMDANGVNVSIKVKSESAISLTNKENDGVSIGLKGVQVSYGIIPLPVSATKTTIKGNTLQSVKALSVTIIKNKPLMMPTELQPPK
ncbi:MAG: hypothetical protein CRN43_20305 [Candidatus Nephrothrix sp. EaCA]|nr:MAG: hypothetical protein CRN43_20305 [Candidatus Nephrothrix sp. EaCA]